mgnify:FL=1
MKKKLYSFTIIITLLIAIINIFLNSNTLNQTITFSSNLFLKNIMPSLFPMFIISSILVEIDIPKVLGNIFKKPMNILFKTKGEGAFIFFMSMITGFPSSAKYINDLLNKKQIDTKDAQKILMFSFFSNPLFIVNTVGIMFLKNQKIGIMLLISHILGNIIIGIIFKNYNQTKSIPNTKINNLKYLNTKINNTNLFTTLITSIKTSIETLINIFGIITFFLIIINILFKTKNIITIPLIGILEMTSGLKYLSISNIDYNIKVLLSMFLISFGGFSVHFQIMSILHKKKVKYLPFLISRIIHGIISVLILIIIIYFL